MLRDLLSSQWFQGGLIFFLLCVGGSLLYSWHVLRTTESDMERRDRFTQGLEKQNEPHPAETVNVPTATESPGLVNTPDENTDTQMPDTTEALPNETENLDIADLFLPDDFVLQEESIKDISISPFGYGAYPEVPEGFPLPVSWQWSDEEKLEFGPEHMRNQEVIDRVLIKLWNQGDHEFYGAIGDDKTVYPLYRNTVYIEWTEIELPDGTTHRHISGFCGPNNFPNLTLAQQMEGEVPAGFHVLDMHEDAIHVSEFLNISK